MSASRDGGGLSLPLPPLLTVDGAVPFVARAAAWDELERAWQAAAGGARRIVLLAGEAGAGKTRILAEFARHVHALGANVLYGACSEEQTVPYQPFAEAFEPLASATAARTAGSAANPPVELAWLGPGAHASADDPAPLADPEAERARRARAVGAATAWAARGRPLLLVLDDLHWARRPTAELLTYLVRDQALTDTLVVGTFRSTPSDIGPALREALPAWHRTPGVTRLRLGGLDAAGIEDFVALAAGGDRPARGGGPRAAPPGFERVVELLARQTDGNPFLLVELWLHLVETGHLLRRGDGYALAGPAWDVSSPDGVREVVAVRLGRLDPRCRELLEAGAVIGPTFSAALAAAALGATVPAVLAALDEAVRSRLVDDDSGAFRFSHELIRRSIYDSLGVAERRRLHHAVALAVGGDALADRARHLLAAVPLVEPAVAVAAAREAAEAASRAVAFDDASYLLEAALLHAGDDRGPLLLESARAMMRAGDSTGAKARCTEAHELARWSGDDDLLAAAALTYSEASWRDGRDADAAAALLRGPLGIATDEALRRRLQTALSRALAIAGEGDAARLLGEDALRSARRSGDPEAVRAALDALSYAPWTPQTIERQLASIREGVQTARATGDPEWESLAIGKLLYGEITVGDLAAARATERRQRQLAERSGQPLFAALSSQAAGLLAMAEGRLDEAERLADAAESATLALSGAPAGGYGVQLFGIRREQGRLDEARPVVEAILAHARERSAWRPALAVMYAELGMLDDASRELGVLTADRLAAVPRDSLWVGALSYLADTCRLVGDRAAAAAVYDELVPWRGLVVHVGFLLAAHGAVDRYLGELASVLGWEREAEIHFEAGLAFDEATGMSLWIARSQLALGRFLTRRGRPADTARARELLDAARATADRLGLVAIGEACRAFSSPRLHAPTAVAGLTDREVAVVGLVAHGCSNREIAARLHISQHTAANHVRSILMKTACANRTEAATWALRHGLGGDDAR